MKQCEYCHKGFSAQSSLKRHVKDKHQEGDGIGKDDPQGAYQCSLCSKVFTRSESLVRHKRLHIGQGTACPICSRLFRKDYLRKHLRSCTEKNLANVTKVGSKSGSAGFRKPRDVFYGPLQWRETTVTPLESPPRRQLPTEESISRRVRTTFRFVDESTPSLDRVAESLFRQLQDSIRKADQIACQALLSKICDLGVSVADIERECFNSLLCLAISRQNIEVAEMLLRHGSNVNGPNSWLRPLDYASRYGMTSLVRCLIENGADIEAVGHAGHNSTALCMAVKQGHKGTVDALLELGADVDNESPLSVALTEGYRDIAVVLIEWGADAKAKDYKIGSPLLWAVENNHLDLLRLMLACRRYSFYGDALLEAIRKGFAEAVEPLLDAGADMENSDENWPGFGALFEAVEGDREDIVRLLLDRGAQVNGVNGSHFHSPLRAAWATKNTRAVKMLLEAGADGSGSIGKWIGGGPCSLEILGALIERGANINLVDHDSSQTALEQALMKGSGEEVEMLIGAGARVDLISERCKVLLIESWVYDARSCERISDVEVKIRLLKQQGLDVISDHDRDKYSYLW